MSQSFAIEIDEWSCFMGYVLGGAIEKGRVEIKKEFSEYNNEIPEASSSSSKSSSNSSNSSSSGANETKNEVNHNTITQVSQKLKQ